MLGWFSTTYNEARDKFREWTRRLGWAVSAFDCDALGPEGERLTCDVAVNAKDAETPNTVIVSSGLHGVEGFFGSAVQAALAQRWIDAPRREPVRLVLIHGLNPYGFAWRRRADAENIDPNRNFVLHEHEFHGIHPLYARLDPLLNPRRPPMGVELFRLRALFTIARFGLANLEQAIAEGQYDRPQGMFFGGRHSSWTRRLLENHLLTWIGASANVVHIDLHTGLGKWGTGKLLLDYVPTTEQREWFGQHFGRDAIQELTDADAAYHVRGALGAWCQHRYPAVRYFYACAEFGTFGPLTTLEALRSENRCHHWAGADDLRTLQAKQRLMKVFCPASPDWRQRTVDAAVAMVDRAVKGILTLPTQTKKRVE